MIRIDDLIGVPFKIHGRNKLGYDCYGLVIEVEKRMGHKMVDLYYDYQKDNNERVLNDNAFNIIKASGLSKVDTPSYGDILLFLDSKRRVTHIGVYLEDDDFIHCDSEGVHISKLSTYFRQWSAFTWQD